MTVRNIIRIISILVILIGTAIVLYPRFTNWQYELQTEKLEKNFDDFRFEAAQHITQGETSLPFPSLLAAMKAYNAELERSGQAGLVDAYSYQTPSFTLTDWGVPNDIIGFLDIPAMDITLPIYLGASEENMRLGAAQLSQTSLPIGSYDGVSTNCVLAAHRGYSQAAMFRNIEVLEPGDQLTITNLWETLTYEVVSTKIILPTQIEEILIQDGKDMLTLTTCHPYRANSHRYIVYCERVTPQTASPSISPPHDNPIFRTPKKLVVANCRIIFRVEFLS